MVRVADRALGPRRDGAVPDCHHEPAHARAPGDAHAGKDGKGKGRWMCRMCMPAGHDVERTRCVELRAFVPNEVPVDDVDLDVEVAASDGVVVRFYLHHDEEEAVVAGASKPA